MEETALNMPVFFHGEPASLFGPGEIPCHERFHDMERYDWDDPGFKRRNKGKYAIVPIPLTQGYFMVVHPSKYRRMTTYPDGSPMKWYAKIDREKGSDRIVKVYARRRGRKALGEPNEVYAARYVTDMLDSKQDIDHVNGWSLDNRYINKKDRVNLEPVSSSKNGSNAFRSRVKNFDLQRGVERRGKTKDGRPLYGGTLRIRRGPKTVDCIRSKRKWTSQAPAHQWYLNQLKRRHRRDTWAFASLSVTYPLFPPLMDSERHTHKRPTKREQRELASLAATF